jgi:phage-related protein
MAAADNIGDVSINITADGTGFDGEVQAIVDSAGPGAGKDLAESLGKALELYIPSAIGPALDELKAQIAIMASEISHGAIYQPDLNVGASTFQAREIIQSLIDQIDAQGATLQVDANTLKAIEELDIAARERIVNLKPEIDKTALAEVDATLAAASSGGGKSGGGGGIFAGIGAGLAAFSAIGPLIILIINLVGALAGVILAAAGGLLAVSAGVASLAAIAAIVPGIILAAGGALAVLLIGIKGLGVPLAGLLPQLVSLKDGIQKAFDAGAVGPIKSAFNSLIGQVKTTFDAIGTSAGNFVGSLAASFQKLGANGGFAALFAGAAPALDILRAGTDTFAQTFFTLGALGSKYLPEIAQYVANIGKSFNTWLQGVTASGELNKMIDIAIANLKTIGNIAGATGDIIGGLFKAANGVSGVTGLQSLLAVLENMAKTIESAPFQSTLITFFEAGRSAVQGLLPAFTALGNLFIGLSTSIGGFVSGSGSALGTLLAGLLNALNTPAVGAGITAAMAGLQTAVSAIVPYLPQLATGFGDLLALAGNLVGVLGGALGPALGIIGSIVSILSKTFEPLVTVLGTLLTGVLTPIAIGLSKATGGLSGFGAAIGPILSGVALAFTNLLPGVTAVVVQLLPVLIKLVISIFTAIVNILPSLITSIVTMLVTLIPVLIEGALTLFLGLITALLKALPAIVAAVVAAIPVLIEAIVAALPAMIQGALSLFLGIINGLVIAIPAILLAIINALPSLITAIVDALPALIQGAITLFLGIITGLLTALPKILVALIALAPILLLKIIEMLPTIIGGAIRLFLGLVTGLISATPQIISALIGLIPQIVSALIASGPQLAAAGVQMIQGIISGFNQMLPKIVRAAEDLAGAALDAIKGALGIKSPSSVFRDEVGVQMAQGLIDGITAMAPGVAKAVNSLVAIPSVAIKGLNTSLSSVVPGVSQITANYGYSQSPNASGNTTNFNVGAGAIPVYGSGDPAQAAQEVVNRLAEKVGL